MADQEHCDAAYDILKCMNQECCPTHQMATFPVRSLRAAEEEKIKIKERALMDDSKQGPRPKKDLFVCVGKEDGKNLASYDFTARELEEFYANRAVMWPDMPTPAPPIPPAGLNDTEFKTDKNTTGGIDVVIPTTTTTTTTTTVPSDGSETTTE